MKLSVADLQKPLLLSPDNFTSLQRTPWAGDRISRDFKHPELGITVGMAIGESWECSCDPDFLSKLEGKDVTLADVISQYPEQMLSPRLAALNGSCELLLKLIHAREPLSLQVHPDDHNPHLSALECGKPESWLVLAAEPGAGIYIGFSEPIEPQHLRSWLEDGMAVEKYLNFIAVKPGDYFNITPGTPHAIGPGVVLLEPQRIIAGKSGKTYRLWDWNRRYDSSGHLDPDGQSRPLHLDAGLELLDPMQQVGAAYAQTVRAEGSCLYDQSGAKVVSYGGNPHYKLVTLDFTAEAAIDLSWREGYMIGLLTHGQAVGVSGPWGQKRFLRGQAGFLPACLETVTLSGEAGQRFVLVCPTGTDVAVVRA